ncbi:Nucleolar protein 9 [Intoshia linei]|uniref:Nucleolar protein 9 n=1 Tax=Intoshia linei TaxID=1819745 RepID=A0A177B962_9BILA|nr:Nucleolar protein 9 [Intoshia linei]
MKEQRDKLPENTISYYHQIKEKIESEELEALFVDNVTEQLSTELLLICKSQAISRIVENFINCYNFSRKHVISLINCVKEDWISFSSHRFSSHVAQTLIKRVVTTMDDNDTSDSELTNLIITIFTSFMQDIEENVLHCYMSHVIRAFIEILTNSNYNRDLLHGKDTIKYKKNVTTKKTSNLCSSESESIINVFTARLFNLPNIDELCINPVANPVIQTVLLSNSFKTQNNITLLKSFIESISSGKIGFSKIMSDRVGSILIENLFKIMTDKMKSKFYKSYIKHEIEVFQSDKLMHNILKGFILYANAKQTKRILKLIEISVILDNKNFVLLSTMSQKLFDLKELDLTNLFIQKIMDEFECKEVNSDLLYYILSMKRPNQLKENFKSDILENRQATYYGSIILQNLINLECEKISLVLINERNDLFVKWCNNGLASRVIDVLLKSSNKEILLSIHEKLMTLSVQLSTSPCGSRIMDKLFEDCTYETFKSIANKLSKRASKISNDKYGRFIWKRLNIELYSKNIKQWECKFNLKQKPKFKKSHNKKNLKL